MPSMAITAALWRNPRVLWFGKTICCIFFFFFGLIVAVWLPYCLITGSKLVFQYKIEIKAKVFLKTYLFMLSNEKWIVKWPTKGNWLIIYSIWPTSWGYWNRFAESKTFALLQRKTVLLGVPRRLIGVVSIHKKNTNHVCLKVLLCCLFPSHSCLPPPHHERPSCSAFVGGFGAPSRSQMTGRGERYSSFFKEVQSQTLLASWSTAHRRLPKLRSLRHSRLQTQLR